MGCQALNQLLDLILKSNQEAEAQRDEVFWPRPPGSGVGALRFQPSRWVWLSRLGFVVPGCLLPPQSQLFQMEAVTQEESILIDPKQQRTGILRRPFLQERQGIMNQPLAVVYKHTWSRPAAQAPLQSQKPSQDKQPWCMDGSEFHRFSETWVWKGAIQVKPWMCAKPIPDKTEKTNRIAKSLHFRTLNKEWRFTDWSQVFRWAKKESALINILLHHQKEIGQNKVMVRYRLATHCC